jgi:hypothetical protein
VIETPATRFGRIALSRLKRTLGLLATDARVAAGSVLLLGLLGTVVYGRILNRVYPIRLWLFWQLATIWAWVAVFSVACASFGHFILIRVLKLRDLPVLESAVLSMAIGVVAFVLAMYVGGAFAWYGPVLAVALPLLMIGVGARDGRRLAQSLLTEIKQSIPRSPFAIAVSAAGLLCLGIVYLGVMTPDALNYDSTWCHLVVAQDYARAGRIVPFPADYTKNVPQLASLIHTWGWLVPGLTSQPLRWMMALHDEFGLFVWTLVGVAAGIRALVEDQALRGTWVTFFLFPIIFVYDHNLGGAADHICAFFAVPILLATLQVCSSFSRGASALFAIVCAGAILTKYQAAYLIAPAGAAIAVHWAGRMTDHRSRRLASGDTPRVALRDLWWSPAIIVGLGAVLVSPHLLRQAIFHRNPFYPLLQEVFRASTPTLPHAAFLFAQTISDANWVPQGTFWQRLWHACKLFATFSFEPHYSFTGNVPSFGSLFTLLLPAILFVRERHRLATAAFMASAALLIWGMVYNVDRNLQIFMPVMVCVTGGLLVKAWRLGWLARAGLIPLVGLQIVWGGDALFYSQYSRIQASMDLIRSGFEGKAPERLAGYRSAFVAIGKALPSNARVLLHSAHVSLGIDREVLLDFLGFQALISYTHLHTARELFDYDRSLGITHFLYEPGARPAGSKQEEVLWNALITQYAVPVGNFGGYRMLRMPSTPPPIEAPYRVAALGIDGYTDGVYPIAAMTTDEYLRAELKKWPRPALAMPEEPEARAALLSDLEAVFVGPRASPDAATTELLHQRFTNALVLPNQFTLYLKKNHHRRR